MSILVHDHPFLKPNENQHETGASPHVDSSGKHFGAEEHLKFIEGIDWKEGEIQSLHLEHRHRHIEEVIDKGKLRWFYRPPGSREAEREIVATGPAIKSAKKPLGEDEEFSS
jgi:hypothetical protein